VRAGVWEGVGEIRCREWADPELTPELVLIRVGACGFCGSDPHIIDGNLRVGRPPQVLGHEVAGEVVAVGSAVAGVEVGWRVACNPYAYCGACPWCRAGQPDHCRHKCFSAKGFAELAVYRPEQLFRLPDDVTMTRGAFLEPVAVALHALDVSGLAPGEHVLVMGAGAVGLLLCQLAGLAGAASVSVSEPRVHNRTLALELGAHRALDPSSDDLEAIAKETGDRGGFDVIFEAAGAPRALEAAPALTSTRARVVVVGVFDRSAQISVSPFLLYAREVSIRGTNSYDRTFPRALPLLGRLALDPMVTSEPLSDIAAVYERHKAGAYVKAQVSP
jgi:L-iditol 2-dehydrogenase